MRDEGAPEDAASTGAINPASSCSYPQQMPWLVHHHRQQVHAGNR